MYDQILLPLDGSKVGETALTAVEDLVAKLVPHHKVEITLFQAVPAMAYYVVAGEASVPVPYTEQELQPIIQKTEDYLSSVAEGLRNKGATVNTRVSAGKAADEILKVAEEINADLIAMSTHGRSGLSRWALGSVTDKILRAGRWPMLIVRAPKEGEGL